MAQIPDLEIRLERATPKAKTYEVHLRFTSPDRDVVADRLDAKGLRISVATLRQHALDSAAYGRCLGESFFAVPGVREFFAKADQVKDEDTPLRVRLDIARNASDLDGLRWEALADPDTGKAGTPLFMHERILFSRVVDSLDWQRPVRRDKTESRALVVVANPSDIAQWNDGGVPLEPIDIAAEVELAKRGLAGVEVTVLTDEHRATLDLMTNELAKGHDILYLVCHGSLIEGQPKLYLETDEGLTGAVAGSALVEKLKGLAPPPRLVVLVACQTAGTGEGEALGALGPTLGEAGIAAVLAMHGKVKMETIKEFMPVFFRELQEHGEIDRAVTVARGEIQERKDYWAPVLYMRLKSGSLWDIPGFSGNGSGQVYEKWRGLVTSIRAHQCTAVLGRGMADSLIGTRRATAATLAEAYNFPLAEHQREDLPQVAQFVYQEHGLQTLVAELREMFRTELLARLGDDAPPDLVKSSEQALDPLVSELGRRRWNADPAAPHRVMAELPLTLYVTTAFDGLIAEALRFVGKCPREELFRWNESADWGPSIYESDPGWVPTVDGPLVYYLAGRLGRPDTLVLTEDDYFDYLIGVTRQLPDANAIPGVVKSAFVNSTLLFLGFDMDGWDFRALFRALMNQGGKLHRSGYVHAGVQIDPDAGRAVSIDRARKYLEKYFDLNDRISIYWGSVEDFARDLRLQPRLRS
jgi:hypothetical protein